MELCKHCRGQQTCHRTLHACGSTGCSTCRAAPAGAAETLLVLWGCSSAALRAASATSLMAGRQTQSTPWRQVRSCTSLHVSGQGTHRMPLRTSCGAACSHTAHACSCAAPHCRPCAGFCTGALYRSARGLRVAGVSGAIGAVAAGALLAGRQYVSKAL